MTVLPALLLGAIHGVAHGVGPDHCAAVAALVSGRRSLHPAAVGVRFGLGHAVALSCLAGIAAFAGILVPAELERALEAFGGALLVVLGGFVLLRASGALVHAHAHGHDHAQSPHAHWHAHLPWTADGHAHRHLPAFVGGALALSGVRGLVIALPALLAARSPWPAIAFVLAFSSGITVAMAVTGHLVGVLSRRGGRAPEFLIGASSLLIGGWWVVASV